MVRVLIVPMLVLAVVALWVYCLADVGASDPKVVRKLPKTGWLLLVVLMPVLGIFGWLAFGRPLHGSLRPGGAPLERHPPSRPPVIGPDDDPNFLGQLDNPR